MMDCKKALIECEGDLEKAIQYLREKGIMKAAKKADRVAAEGLVFDAISDDQKIGALIEINSETDFVAKNEAFQNFGRLIATYLLDHDVKDIDELYQTTIDGVTIKDKLSELIAKIGENMHIRRFQKEVSEGFVSTYIHMGGKIGVIANFLGNNSEENQEIARDVTLHIAAMAPEYLNKDEVPSEVLEKEKTIMKNQLLEAGKPEKIIDKIVEGKVSKFYEDNCLLYQKFVKDDKVSVQDFIGNLKIQSFTRYKLGEGIEKEEKDFAAEVAEQMKS